MPLTIDLMENPVFARLYHKGRDEGRSEGRDEGRSEGRNEGRKEGRAQEGRAILQRLLTKRFGPLPTESEALLQTLTIEQIEDASLRILDVQSIAEVFTA